MADIDMIPRSYRNALRARRLLVCYGAALGLLLAAGAATAVGVRWQLARQAPQLQHMRSDATRAAALRAQVAASEQRRGLLAANGRAFAALRGTGTPAALARAIDDALGDSVWLERLAFDRKHELLPASGPGSAGAVQVSTAGPAGQQEWRITNQVEIGGRALDQAALAAFLAALSASPALADVRFIDSSLAPGDNGMLAFHAAATLRQLDKAP